MQTQNNEITILLLLTTFLVMLMGAFILTILFLHRKRLQTHYQNLKKIEAHYEKTIMKTQLEIQEQTFQHISREIHDNISLSLTLVKLHLNTLEWKNISLIQNKIENSIDLLTKSINELNNISKGLNAEIIFQQGLIKAIEDEMDRIRQIGLFVIEFSIVGEPIYMHNQKELIAFRIVQEAFNNIIKHANATRAWLSLQYINNNLEVGIRDNGKGFDSKAPGNKQQAGLRNMETRIKILKGNMEILSQIGLGTTLSFTIPFE